MALKIDLEVNGLTKNLVDATYLVLKRISGKWVLIESEILDVPYDESLSIFVTDSALYEFDDVMVIITDCDGSNYSTAGTATDFIHVSEVYKDFSVVPLNDFFVQCDNRTLAYTPWDMGDGTILTEEDPFYMYRDNGTFTISNADFSQDIVITGVTKFSVKLEGSVIICTKQSGTEGEWAFGNGDTDKNDNTSYIFYENGTFIVTYDGFSETIVVDYYTDMIDRIDGYTVYFNRPEGAEGPIDCGDGNITDEDYHEYAMHGRYVIEVDGYHGVVNIASLEMPAVGFSYVISQNDPAMLTFTGDGADSYEFIINDESLVGDTVSYDFRLLGGGIYPVKCIGDVQGNKGVASQNILVQLENIAPTLTINEPIHNLREVTFEAVGSDTEGETLSYFWTLGDQETSYSRTFTHNYPADGTYTVTCKVSDDRTPSLSATETITVVVNSVSSLESNLLAANNSNLVNMISDDNGLLSGFYYNSYIFDNGELEAVHSNGSSSGRMQLKTTNLGLTVGSTYKFSVSIKSSASSTDLKINSPTGGSVNSVELDGDIENPANLVAIPLDGEYHTASITFECKSVTENSDIRIYGIGNFYLNSISINKVVI